MGQQHTDLKTLIHTTTRKLLGHNNDQATLLLGLSGGPDSIFLLHCLRNMPNITLEALHMNYGWRDTANRDEEFCIDVCAQHNIKLTITTPDKWDDYIPAHKKAHGSPESLARHARRAALEHHATKIAADGIILGHHSDDQLETFLIRLVRGSSLAGLCGMHARAGSYLRPALTLSRADIISWLSEQNYSYCHDESNDDPRHLRNRIRATALPALLAVDDRAQSNMHTTMTRLQDDDELLSQIATDIYTSLVNNEGALPREQFIAMHRALQVRLLLIMLIEHRIPFTPSTPFFDEVRRFLASLAGGSHQVNEHCCIVKKQGWFSIK